MGIVYTANSREIAEAIARYLGKNTNQVKKDSREGYLTFDLLKDESEPSLSIKVENNKLLVYRFGDSDQTKHYEAVKDFCLKNNLAHFEQTDSFQKITHFAEAKAEEYKREYKNSRQKFYSVGETKAPEKKQPFKIEKVYNYTNEAGEIVYQCLRGKQKSEFAYNRKIPLADRVLYNLDLLYQARKAQGESFKVTSTKTLSYIQNTLREEIKAQKLWFCWTISQDIKRGKNLKMPCSPQGEALRGWNNLSLCKTVADLDDEVIQSGRGDNIRGYGLLITAENPLVFIDFDNVLAEGELPTEQTIPFEYLNLTAGDVLDYYVELSQSGRGYHILLKLRDSELKKNIKQIQGGTDLAKKAGFEVYTQNKFCACTFEEVEQFKLTLADKVTQTKFRVFIVEGEKDADTLKEKGLLATTNPFGANSKWLPSYTETLKGFDCVVIADNDNAGLSHSITVSNCLYYENINVKRLTFSENEVEEKGDVTDYLSNHSLEDLLAKVEKTPAYTPSKEEIIPFEDKYQIEAELRRFSFDTIGNAQRVLAYTGGNLKWVEEANETTPFIYDEAKGIWRNSPQEAESLAQIALRKIPEEILAKHTGLESKEKEFAIKWARTSQTPKTAKDALSTSRSLDKSTINASLFDKHPKLNNGKCFINCKNGTVDLCTGKLLEHSKERYITQFCDIEYNPEATSTLWEKCLLDIFEGDQSLVDNFQINMGYASMGYPKEKVFYIFYGDAGDTGKSTVLETLKNVLGVDYAGEIPFSTIQVKDRDDEAGKADSFLARNTNTHLVTISETATREGRRASLNYEKVKTLSGADTLPVRELYKTASSFSPKFTLLIALNNKPKIADYKDSTWERMRIYPFVHKFTGAEKDPKMAEKLLQEKEGIFNWLVQGAIKYNQLGELPKHHKVEEAVKEYEFEENPLAECFEEMFTFSNEGVEQREKVLEAISLWFAGDEERESQEKPSQHLITKALKGRGIQYRRDYKRVKGLRVNEIRFQKLKEWQKEQEAKKTLDLLGNN